MPAAAAASFGMVLVSGVVSSSDAAYSEGNMKGVLLGLGAAAMYAAVVLLK